MRSRLLYLFMLAAEAALCQKPAGLDVVITLDVGETMIEGARQIAAGTRLALYELAPDDRVAVMAFGSSPKLHSDFTDASRKTEESMHRATRWVIRRAGKSRLYDALHAAVMRFPEWLNASRRRAVLIFTDSVDEGSRTSVANVVQEASRRGVTIYGSVITCARPFLFGPNPCADTGMVVKGLRPLTTATKGGVSVRSLSGYALREAIARLKSGEVWD